MSGCIDKIATELDSNIEDNSDNTEPDSEGEGDNDELSKEELAEKLDVQFAKTSPQSETQHLVQSGESEAVCGRVELASNSNIVDKPSPFDPVCKRCRASIQGNSLNRNASGQTYNDLRSWLANEIKSVEEPKKEDSSEALRKSEAAAVVEHIKSLKKQIGQDGE